MTENFEQMLHVVHGTGGLRRKLRLTVSTLAATLGLLVLPALAFLALPALADAQVAVAAYPVSTTLDSAPSGGSFGPAPALAADPDGSQAEWFVVNGSGQDVLSITPSGRQSLVARGLESANGQPVTYASVDADGYDWILDNDQSPGNVLYAVGSSSSVSPGLNQVARFGDYGQDMALGPDGALYISDSDGIIRCAITDAPTALCTTASIPPPFYTGAGAYAIDGGGNAIWFTDALGELGADSTIGAGFSGPYPSATATVGSLAPGTIVTASNGDVYMASGAIGSPLGYDNEILAFDPSTPNQESVAISGLGDVVAMTIGPDGNIWFLDANGLASSTGNTGPYVGELSISDGSLSTYPLPDGYTLPSSGCRIASGPTTADSRGEGSVFFTAQTTGPDSETGEPDPAIGVITGIPFPQAVGTLSVEHSLSVNQQRQLMLSVTCSGPSNATCDGTMKLDIQARLRVRVQVRSPKRSSAVRFRVVTRAKRLTLAKLPLGLRGGYTYLMPVTLTNSAYNLLESVVGHRWSVSVATQGAAAAVPATTLTMVGPVPPKPRPLPVKPQPKPKPKPKHRAKPVSSQG